jgi:GNAT superfamily N-acetyltransferase
VGLNVAFSSPEPVAAHHQVADFDSGIAQLDNWLKQRAFKNELSGASRTYVACDRDVPVGYYALAAGSVDVDEATGRFRRNMPDPTSVVVLGRLAVDHNHQGRGLGRALFLDAARRIIAAAGIIGIRGILVHAMSEDAQLFYRRLGFESSPISPLTLMVTLADVRTGLD